MPDPEPSDDDFLNDFAALEDSEDLDSDFLEAQDFDRDRFQKLENRLKTFDQEAFNQSFDKIFAQVGLGILAVFNPIGLLLVFLATATGLNCQRLEPNSGVCTLKRIQGPTASEKILQTFPVEQLQGAEIESYRSDSTTYRVILLTDQAAVPLSSAYSSGYDEKAAIADQINAFVDNPQQTELQVQQDDRWIFYLIGGMFMLIGSAVGFPFVAIGWKALWGNRKSRVKSFDNP